MVCRDVVINPILILIILIELVFNESLHSIWKLTISSLLLWPNRSETWKSQSKNKTLGFMLVLLVSIVPSHHLTITKTIQKQVYSTLARVVDFHSIKWEWLFSTSSYWLYTLCHNKGLLISLQEPSVLCHGACLLTNMEGSLAFWSVFSLCMADYVAPLEHIPYTI
jgi:hypothetical protein